MKSKYSFRKEWYENIIENPSGYYMEPFQIVGNLYFVGNRDGASHLIDTGEGLILFDTGYPNMSGMLLHSIWKCGFRPEDIKMIFHTHGHFDHFGATRLLTTISGAQTYLGKADARMMRERPEFALCDYLGGIPTEFFAPDVELEDGQEICLGNTCVRAIHTPGHSQGAMTYLFRVTDKEQQYQAVLCGGTGFNTLNREFMEQYQIDWRSDFAYSLEKWRQIKADIYLGNHTPQSQVMEKLEKRKAGEKNPFIDPAEWDKYVDQLEKRYNDMIREEG